MSVRDNNEERAVQALLCDLQSRGWGLGQAYQAATLLRTTEVTRTALQTWGSDPDVMSVPDFVNCCLEALTRCVNAYQDVFLSLESQGRMPSRQDLEEAVRRASAVCQKGRVP